VSEGGVAEGRDRPRTWSIQIVGRGDRVPRDRHPHRPPARDAYPGPATGSTASSMTSSGSEPAAAGSVHRPDQGDLGTSNIVEHYRAQDGRMTVVCDRASRRTSASRRFPAGARGEKVVSSGSSKAMPGGFQLRRARHGRPRRWKKLRPPGDQALRARSSSAGRWARARTTTLYSMPVPRQSFDPQP